jgi:hypothetical protein
MQQELFLIAEEPHGTVPTKRGRFHNDGDLALCE